MADNMRVITKNGTTLYCPGTLRAPVTFRRVPGYEYMWFHVTGTVETALAAFADGMDRTEWESQSGVETITEIRPLSDFAVLCEVTDLLDGSFSVLMAN
jgi:hypothetical protein